MHGALWVGLAKDIAYPLKPPSIQATGSHPGKAKSYEPKALNEEKEKYHYFTHPAQNHTNFHLLSTKEKE